MFDRVLRVLEYPKIIEHLRQHVASSLGKEKVEQLKPSFNYSEVVHGQQSTYEGTTLLRLKGTPPLGGIKDIRPSLKRLAIQGILHAHELIDIASTLYGGRRLKQFIEALEEEAELPIIKGLASQISSLKPTEQAINACINEQGEIVDEASPALRQIRAQIRSLETRIRQKLDQLSKSSSIQKMLQEGIVTIRNERYCLPVKAEYRSYFGGIVHDQSASGATLFIEPEEVVILNNQLRETKLKEEQEIERILRDLSEQVGQVLEPLSQNVEALAELDFIFAKAQYAVSIRAVQPKLNQSGYFKLKQARHPLIPKEEIVPISFELGKPYKALIITGPNTGGKTVTLKTLGLLTLMACSGLAIPAEEGTEIAVVSAVFADIGDEQSIEQSLSTFSSHMTNIVRILEEFDHQSLVLFDELGAGTDPTEGAALAMSILDYVLSCGANVVATTHYSELKAYAYTKREAINASVEFDVETLRPTYRLLVGVPGRSNAFSIAKRLGLDEEIINKARNQINEDDLRVEKMLASLEENQKRAEQARRESEALEKELAQLRLDFQRKQTELEQEKQRRIAQAEREARERMDRIMQEAEAIIAELRQRAQQEEPFKDHLLIEAKKNLEAKQGLLKSGEKKQQRSRKKQENQVLIPGDEVFVHTFGQKGHILEKISTAEYLVQIGIMKMKVNRDALEKIKTKEEPKIAAKASVSISNQPVKLELDLRGQTIDDAMMEIDKYIDNAILSGYQQVAIIHGKGTGQLRKGVQEFLKNHRHVKRTRLGGVGEGGSGVTIVELK